MFKVQEIREIIRLIDQSSISEFVYENDGATISIKKSVENKVVEVVEPTVESAKVVEAEVQQQVVQKEEAVAAKELPKVEAEAVEVAADENVVEIVSPMVGTFYRRP